MTGCERLFGEPLECAGRIMENIKVNSVYGVLLVYLKISF